MDERLAEIFHAASSNTVMHEADASSLLMDRFILMMMVSVTFHFVHMCTGYLCPSQVFFGAQSAHGLVAETKADTGFQILDLQGLLKVD